MHSSTSNSEELLRFVLHLAAFAALVLIVLTVLERSRLPLRHLEPRLVELDRAGDNAAEVILFGSSVNRYFAPRDTDRRSIDELLNERLTDWDVVGISQGALDGDNFASYARYIVEQDIRPRVVIFPINLRALAVSWYMRPEYQFEREKKIAKGPALWQQFVAVMGEDNKRLTQEEYLDVPYVFRGETRTLRSNLERFGDEPLRAGFIDSYLYDLTREHPSLLALREAGRTLQAAGVSVIFYITPVDVTTGQQLVASLEETVTTNAMLIVQTIQEGFVLDLSKTLAPERFSYPERPNEHLDEIGRKAVAAALESVVTRELSRNAH